MQTTLHDLTGDRTMLVLAAAPGDESLACGALIAEACARGRPPLVAVLTDGASLGAPDLSPDTRATAHERETRAALAALGLAAGRVLMLGVRDDAIPVSPAFFEQIADAIGFLTWMRDLNLICAPADNDPRPAQALAGALAAAVAERTGIGRIAYGAAASRASLPIAGHATVKARAIAVHGTLRLPLDPDPECFMPWHGG